MSKNLVIVESPTKAKTIKKFLGKDFDVESSFGHVSDLPKKELGIDIKNNFEPTYIVPDKSQKTIDKLKKLATKSTTIYFATDEDREGEAISWHLARLLNTPQDKIKRIVFHEITKKAILEAVQNPIEININLVNAQQARRVLDRLVGYKLSPFLWSKVARGLSAGRVQSVAVRLIVEREREITVFKPEEYWSILGNFEINSNNENKLLETTLSKIKDTILKKFDINNETQANELVVSLKTKNYNVGDISLKQIKKSPKAPFTTSTLQQSAGSMLHFSPKQTMMLAQQLYEGIEITGEGSVGLITYMRTDSVNLSSQFLDETKTYITNEFGKKYHTGEHRFYKSKSKNAQEAHEAIRPTNVSYTPDFVKASLDDNQFKLYKLIWQRAVASQMSDAITNSTTIEIQSKDSEFTFKATGSTIEFDGFLKVYPTDSKEIILPNFKTGENALLKTIEPKQHFTQPPARYNEPTLVKALEEHGIGRPSTYAPTISTIQDRNYVIKGEDKKLRPTDIAYVVIDLLVNHFKEVVDYQFTAQMEEDLDLIATGEKQWQKIIASFYEPFENNIKIKEKEIDKKNITEEKTDQICPNCSFAMIIKVGRFGKFIACTNYPKCKTTKPFIDENSQSADQNTQKEPEITTDQICEKCQKPMVIKIGRFGKFLGCSSYPECKNIKSISKSIGVKCPKCEVGEVVEKRTKAKKIFYGCDKYPECDFAMWSKPTGNKCPQCNSLTMFGAKDKIKCSSKECDWTGIIEN